MFLRLRMLQVAKACCYRFFTMKIRCIILLSCIVLFRVFAVGIKPCESVCPVLPSDNIWNTPVDTLPVDANSAAYIATIGSAVGMHADFGSGTWNGGPIGIPYIFVPGTQPKVPIHFVEYGDESDPGPYPIPPNAPIEWGSDHHVLVMDTDHCKLYELYHAAPQADGSWNAGSGAIYDLNSHALRPDGWTSADAAGLPIFPGLVRYDEVAASEIRHALRFTVPQTRKAYVWPARHFASSLTASQYPPMGQRFRLKANVDIASFAPEVQVILRALQKYGMMIADNGSAWYLSGAPDERWDNDHLSKLSEIHGSDFEAVNVSSLMVDPNSGRVALSPPAATLVSPSGTISTTTPTYTWNAVSNATWYYLWVNGPSGNMIQQWYSAAQAGCGSGTGTCSVTPTTTLATGNHTWWIQTWNQYGYGSWSAGLTFTVVTPPPAATLVAPAGTSCDATPTYIWNAVSTATWYYLWVNGPSGNVVKQWYTAAQAHCASGTGTCAVVPATTLASGTHTWWIQTWNDVGYGPWSAGQSFTETPGSVPGAVTLIAPSGSTTNPPPYYWWYEDSCATWYYLWVNGPSGTAVIQQWYTAAQANCNGTWCWVTNATTLPVGTNTWWVQTWNSAGYGPWSSGLTFTISTSGSQTAGMVVTVRKQGAGSGTILVGDQVCGPECLELTLPYTDGAQFTLQAIPAADSRFVGWQTVEGNIVEGTLFYAQPGETVIAVFEKQE
jgi:hypothetical protein